MKILKTSREADVVNMVRAVEVLEEGEVVIHATETCYGIACDLTNAKAVQKLFMIKQRPEHQPVSALFASVEQAKEYVEWSEKAEEYANKFLPGPLTLILPLRSDAPHQLFATPTGTTTIGVRISSHEVASRLVTSFGRPISTTSANIHGQPPIYSAEEIIAAFSSAKHQPALFLESGSLPRNPPSTIINLAEEGGVLRKGAI